MFEEILRRGSGAKRKLLCHRALDLPKLLPIQVSDERECSSQFRLCHGYPFRCQVVHTIAQLIVG